MFLFMDGFGSLPWWWSCDEDIELKSPIIIWFDWDGIFFMIWQMDWNTIRDSEFLLEGKYITAINVYLPLIFRSTPIRWPNIWKVSMIWGVRFKLIIRAVPLPLYLWLEDWDVWSVRIVWVLRKFELLIQAFNCLYDGVQCSVMPNISNLCSSMYCVSRWRLYSCLCIDCMFK